MFELQEIKEYWTIITVNDDGDDPRVVQVSEDIRNEDDMSFVNGVGLIDTMIEDSWYDNWWDAEGKSPGVYKLTLEPQYCEDDVAKGGNPDEPPTESFIYFTVAKAELLFCWGIPPS